VSAVAWRPVAVLPALAEHGVQVWLDRLSAAPPWSTLDLPADDAARAQRLLVAERRAAFVRGRQLVRFAVAPLLGVAPRDVPLEVLPSGKPIIAPSANTAPLHISLAHTGDWVLVAVSRAGEVGVDIERTDRVVDRDAIIRRYFAAEEQAGIAAYRDEARTAAFTRVWARKEAIAKGTGDGLAGTLTDFAVPVAEGAALPITRTSPAWQAEAAWWLHELEAPLPSIAALALRQQHPRIDRLRWV
jgi:4'-phosphopantetheinyl transferase